MYWFSSLPAIKWAGRLESHVKAAVPGSSGAQQRWRHCIVSVSHTAHSNAHSHSPHQLNSYPCLNRKRVCSSPVQTCNDCCVPTSNIATGQDTMSAAMVAKDVAPAQQRGTGLGPWPESELWPRAQIVGLASSAYYPRACINCLASLSQYPLPINILQAPHSFAIAMCLRWT